MGTISTNLLPNATGLDIGSPSQRFDVFAKTLTADDLTTNSANPATTGEINLASTDTIAWRNAANNADVLLSKSQGAGALPADTLQWPNGVSAAEFVTATANPSTTGIVRLATADTINFRNNANSGDLNGLAHNTDDTIQVGDTAGIKSAAITSSGTVISGGTFATLSGTNLTVQPQGSAGNSAAIAASGGTTGGAVNVTAGAGSAGNGGSVTITGGASATAAVGGAVVLVPGSGTVGQAACVLNGTVTIANKISSYDSVTTGGQGVPVIVGVVDLTFQTAASSGTIYAIPASDFGQYRISWNAKITAAATGAATSTLGPFTLSWTAVDGTVVTTTGQAAQNVGGSIVQTNTTNATNSTGILLGMPVMINCRQSTNIDWAMAYASNAANTMTYTLHIMLEYLG